MAARDAGLLYTCGRIEIDLGDAGLRMDGRAIRLGGRSFEVLEVLVRSAGRVVSKDDLIERVWAGAVVEENTIQAHVSALRKALGPERQLVKTVSGRGYMLLGTWSVGTNAAAGAATPILPTVPSHNLPLRVARSVGREEAIRAIVATLLAVRLVSVTGPGGIGKTTVALAAANDLLDAFDGMVCFIDLGPVHDPSLVGYAIASTLGLAVRTDAAVSGIIAFLKDRRMLLILDCCEHVVESVAILVEKIYQEAPLVHILTTSREALRVDGEHVHALAALEVPPVPDGLTAEEARRFSAVALFVERAAAKDSGFTLTDAEAPYVAEICRTLDGLPLAIQLAAGRVSVFGVRETARLLKGRFRLLWEGNRLALPRHRTLAATLDWSHALLSDVERIVLRRLSIFAGTIFGLAPVLAVAATGSLTDDSVIEGLAGLVTKSLVVADVGGKPTGYRLLDTTRAYAHEKLVINGELTQIALRHAQYFRGFLDSADLGPPTSYADHIGNVRTALEWSFGDDSDPDLASGLALAAAPLFLRLSLLTECHRWAERGLALLDERSRGTRREMELQAALGEALMFTTGNSDRVRETFERGLAIATDLGDLERQLQFLGWLSTFHVRTGNIYATLRYSKFSKDCAEQLGNPAAIAVAGVLLGAASSLLGYNEEARDLLITATTPLQADASGSSIHQGFDYGNSARVSMARTLWLMGYPDQGLAIAMRNVEDAMKLRHPTTLCIALVYAVSLFLWARDHAGAERLLRLFIDQAQHHSLAPYLAAAMGMQGELLVRGGRVEEGVGLLRRSLEALHAERYETQTASFSFTLAEGLASLGRFNDALATIDAAIRVAERKGDLVAMPEMLRVKGEVLARIPGVDPNAATAVFMEAIELAASQAALAWELRTATSLARFLGRGGNARTARDLLASVYDRFTEGFDTADLRSAAQMLGDLAP